MIEIDVHDSANISLAVETLKQGGVVIYPTETCYALGVDPTNARAVDKLLNFKNNQIGKGVSLLVADAAMADKFIVLTDEAKHIYQEFLPGPVTVISKSREQIDKRIEGENGTIGIRISSHAWAGQLVREFGKPITTTAATIAGGATPYDLKAIESYVSSDKLAKVDLFINAGTLPKRAPSTVIDATLAQSQIYRQGGVGEIKESFTSNSESETVEIGEKIALKYSNLLNECVLIFWVSGQLGAGKTHLAKGFGHALKVPYELKSPTYTFLSEYDYQLAGAQGQLIHIDAWRITNRREWDLLAIEEYLKVGNLILVEWGARISDVDFVRQDIRQIKVDIIYIDEETRAINVSEITNG